jgi:hypothetical protein
LMLDVELNIRVRRIPQAGLLYVQAHLVSLV